MPQIQTSQSYKSFSIKFKALMEKATLSESTIFSNFIDKDKIENIDENLILEHYDYFLKNYNYAYHQAPFGEKGKIINQSIQESFLQHTFNQYLDGIILESTKENKPIGLTTQILLENTFEKFNLDAKKVGINYLNSSNPHDAIEENIFGFGAGLSSVALGAGAAPALAISMITSFALGLLVPASKMNYINQWIGDAASVIARAVTGSFSLWKLGYTPALGTSHQNILDFDNIDADPKVKELFKKIQKVSINDSIAERGLTSLTAECIHQNSNILSMVEGPKNGLFDGFFTPNKYNVLKLVIKAIIGKSESDKNDQDTLIRFRKCLATKLSDVYKLLLISNLQGKKDFNKILNTITKVNTNNPEQATNFLPSETDEDKQLKEAILGLIMFRLHLKQLADNLEKGFFEVDKEAGQFLHQKLKSVDSEVEVYLRNHKPKFDAPFEGKLMDKKPSLTKRSLLSKHSLIN